MMHALGFKARNGAFACVSLCLHGFTSGAIHADLLTASVAAESFWIHVIIFKHWWDLNPQSSAWLPSESCRLLNFVESSVQKMFRLAQVIFTITQY